MKSKRVLGAVLAATVAFSNCNVLWADTATDNIGIEAYDESTVSAEGEDEFIPTEDVNEGDVLLDGNKIKVEAEQKLNYKTTKSDIVNGLEYTSYLQTNSVDTTLTVNGVTKKYRVAFKITAKQDTIVYIDNKVACDKTNCIFKQNVNDGTIEVVTSKENDIDDSIYTTLCAQLKAGDIVYFAGQGSNPAFYSIYTAETVDFGFDASTGEITGYTGTDAEVTIPEKIGRYTVTGIADGAFNSENITSITIPSTITSISDTAFSNCSNLKNITVAEDNNSFKMVDGALIAENGTKLIISLPKSDITNYTVPTGIKTICGLAFRNYKNLTSIEIPYTVTTISEDAFEECSNLKTVYCYKGSVADNSSLYPTDTQIVYEDIEGSDIFIPTEAANTGDVLFDGNKIKVEATQKLNFNTTKNPEVVNGVLYPSNLQTSGTNTALYVDGSYNKSYRIACKITAKQDTTIYLDHKVTSGKTNYIIKGDITSGSSTESLASKYNSGSSSIFDTLSVELKSGEEVYFVGCASNPTFYSVYTDKEELNAVNFDFDASTGEITGYTGRVTDITIPDEIDGHTVTGIADGVFKDSRITSITLPSTITSIGDNTFYGCSRLTDITLPDNVKTIGANAFYDCSGLTDITLPDNITTIGENAFYGCSGLTIFYIPGKVESIGENAFARCSNLQSVTVSKSNSKYKVVNGGLLTKNGKEFVFLPAQYSDETEYTVPNGVEKIHNYAFDGCANLKNVTVPNSVTSMGNHIFYNCSNLESVTIGKGIDKISDYSFYDCSALTSVNNSTGILSVGNYAFYNCSKLSTLNTSAGVASDAIIGDYAFYGCNSLTDVNIANGVASIGEYAFYNCSGLTGVSIPNSVKSIGNYAFYNCTGLTSVGMADGVTDIGEYAFYNCSGLTSINIPKGITSIKDYTFAKCSSLTSINIPDGVTSIGDSAFHSCSSSTSVTIPDSVTSIGNSAFCACRSLTSITIPDSVTSIGNSAFYGCSSLTSVTIPNSVTSIGDSVFYYCSGLKSVTIPDSVKSIGNSAFYGCSSLTSVTIPNSVTSIGDSVFYYCNALKSVTIPDSVTSIGNSAFYGCSNLTSVIIPNSVTSIGDSVFYYCNGLKSVTIPDSVTSIGDYAFYNCSGLTGVTIPDSLTSIGNYAFYNCSGLKSVTIPYGVISIGDYAFYYCTGFKNVTIPSSVEEVGTRAFYNTSITTVYCDKNSAADDTSLYPSGVTFAYENVYTDDNLFTFNNGVITRYKGSDIFVNIPTTIGGVAVTGIGSGAFVGKTTIKKIKIPESVTDIAYDAFESCTKLENITVNAGNTAYKSVDGILLSNDGTELLHYPSNITETEYTVPDGVKTIGGLAFESCENLTSIELPNTLETIEKYAFYGCNSLESIEIPYTVTSISEDAFEECNLETVYCYESSAADNSSLYTTGAKIIYVGRMPIKYTSDEYFDIDEDGIITVYNGKDTDVIIPETIKGTKVTEIDTSSFANTNITSVKIPSGVTRIGRNAFANCKSLKTVIIPSSISTVMSTSFTDCTSLETVYCYKDTVADNNKLYPSGVKIVYIGNVNSDSTVDKTDAALILKSVNVVGTASSVEKTIRDYNMDGYVDILDIISLLKDVK